MTHRSVLWPAKRVTGTESIIFSVKNQENAWLLLESLEKWLSYKLRRFLMFLIFFISFNPFSLGKTEKLDFWDSNNSTNFKHQQVTTNMTGPPQNIWMFCNTIEQKAAPTIFLNISQKYYQLPILGVLNMSGHFHQKNNTEL